MHRILLIEPEKGLCVVFRDWFANEFYAVECAANERLALCKLNHGSFDIVIVDLLIGTDEVLSFCRQLRFARGDVPILLLTGRASAEEAESCLDAGADDYLARSTHLRELSARVRRLLRRPQIARDDLLVCRGVAINPCSGTVSRQGELIHLQPMEFNLLEFLMRHPGQTFTAEALWERLWGDKGTSLVDTVRTHIKTIRQKIDSANCPSVITTVRGRGYKIEAWREEVTGTLDVCKEVSASGTPDRFVGQICPVQQSDQR